MYYYISLLVILIHFLNIYKKSPFYETKTPPQDSVLTWDFCTAAPP